MVAGSDYSSTSAQQYANENYFECDDDGWIYISPVPCEGVDVCRQKCGYCGQSFPCDEFDDHDCPDKDKDKKVICEYCKMEFTPEELKEHDCPHKPNNGDTGTGGGNTGGWNTGGGNTGGNKGDSGNTSPSTPPHSTPAKSNVSKTKLVNNFKSSKYNRTYNGKTCNYCLRGWKTIWQKSGIGEYDNTTRHAKDFGSVLIKYGFKVIHSGKGSQRPLNYTPQIGDTRIWDTYPGQRTPSGHIDWWNGTHWVSDFVQQNKWLPGSKYKEYNVSYKIYR